MRRFGYQHRPEQVSRWRLVVLVLGGVLYMFRGTQGRGRRGEGRWVLCVRGLAGGVEVGQGPGVVEPGVVQDDRGLLFFLGLSLEAAPS